MAKTKWCKKMYECVPNLRAAAFSRPTLLKIFVCT